MLTVPVYIVSDEGVAAFVTASGGSLVNFSVNSVQQVYISLCFNIYSLVLLFGSILI